jgi:hypothetical protein
MAKLLKSQNKKSVFKTFIFVLKTLIMKDLNTTPQPRKKRHFFRNLLLILIAIGIGFSTLLYFGIYDEGVRAGIVVRISKKGVLFKTYEGQLNLESFGALKGSASPFLQTFDFSVDKSRPDIVKELEAVSLSGERVNLHYIKRYAKFPWRGETKYFITGVEREGVKPPKE